MTWFKVDDKLHAHSKVRKVLAEDPAALALWTVAGSWSSGELTDGFVPDHQLPWLIPVGAEALASRLVSARLWRRVRGGYQFHEWSADGDGSKRNPTKAEVEAERLKKAEAGRKGGQVRAARANEKKVHPIGGASREEFAPTADGGGATEATADAAAKADATEPRDDPETATTSNNGSSTGQAPASTGALAPAESGALFPLDPPSRPVPSFSASKEALDLLFAEFWANYPRHPNHSKKKAREVYEKKLKAGALASDINRAATLYAADRLGDDPHFTAHASTWLNEERWVARLEDAKRAEEEAAARAVAPPRPPWEN